MRPLVSAAPGTAATPQQQDLRFRRRLFKADVSNFFLLHYREVDGFLVTGKNSGTHWFKFMLSCAIAAQHGLAPPERSNGREGDAIIGHPRWPRRYPQLPRIGSSHNIPSRAFICPVLRSILPYRPTVVLVRDISQAMLSNFLKWRREYGVKLSEYVHGDASGRRYVADAWWYVHFFNIWGELARLHPGETLVVRYEDLQRDPATWLRRAAAQFGISLSAAALQAGLEHVDRDALRSRLEAGSREMVVPDQAERAAIAFSPADEAVLGDILRRHLKHDFGYGYLGLPGGVKPQC